MKARVLFGLALFCFILSLGIVVGLTVSKGVQAQVTGPFVQPPTLSVLFEEDPLRQHGRQVWSKHFQAVTSHSVLVDSVPYDKKFILTDVLTNTYEIIYFSKDSAGSQGKAHFSVEGAGNNLYVNLISGIVFEPGESIYAKSTNGTALVTISGYFVDTP